MVLTMGINTSAKRKLIKNSSLRLKQKYCLFPYFADGEENHVLIFVRYVCPKFLADDAMPRRTIFGFKSSLSFAEQFWCVRVRNKQRHKGTQAHDLKLQTWQDPRANTFIFRDILCSGCDLSNSAFEKFRASATISSDLFTACSSTIKQEYG